MEHEIVKIVIGGIVIPAVCLYMLMKLMKRK